MAHAARRLPLDRGPRSGPGDRPEEARRDRSRAALDGSGAVVGRWRAALAAAVGEVRRRPLHVALRRSVRARRRAARAARGPRGAPRCPLLARRAAGALLVAVALLGGAVLADARLAALDHTVLTERLGHAASVHAWLIEPARPRPFGGRRPSRGPVTNGCSSAPAARVRWPAVRVGEEVAVDGVLEALRPADAWLRPRNVHAILRASGSSRPVAGGAVSPGCSTGSASAPRRRSTAACRHPRRRCCAAWCSARTSALGAGDCARTSRPVRARAPRRRERPERHAARAARRRPARRSPGSAARAAARDARADRALRAAGRRRPVDPAGRRRWAPPGSSRRSRRVRRRAGTRCCSRRP